MPRQIYLTAVAVLGLMVIIGCQGTPRPAVIGLQTDNGTRRFAQRFPRAYFSQSADGDREVVLIDDGYPQGDAPSHGPVKPVAAIPLRQVMHFKILWDPPHGTQADAPSTTNAIIDWTIRTTDRSGNSDTLRYQGAGFVLTSGGGDELWMSIRSATLESTQHTGSLIDPLGHCSLSGSFTAFRNEPLVAATVTDMRQEPVAAAPVAASPASSSESGPPMRVPSP